MLKFVQVCQPLANVGSAVRFTELAHSCLSQAVLYHFLEDFERSGQTPCKWNIERDSSLISLLLAFGAFCNFEIKDENTVLLKR